MQQTKSKIFIKLTFYLNSLLSWYISMQVTFSQPVCFACVNVWFFVCIYLCFCVTYSGIYLIYLNTDTSKLVYVCFSYNRRKLDELPFQVFHLSGSIKEEFLYNHSWLFVKLCGSDVYHVSSYYPLLKCQFNFNDTCTCMCTHTHILRLN